MGDKAHNLQLTGPKNAEMRTATTTTNPLCKTGHTSDKPNTRSPSAHVDTRGGGRLCSKFPIQIRPAARRWATGP